jgi:hypothetical protein
MNWSQNAHEEREAPNHILIGAMDPLYCVLLGLAVFLEIFIESERGQLNPYIFGFNDDFRILEGGRKTKDWVQNMLAEEVFHLPEFHVSGPVGTHSIRKYAEDIKATQEEHHVDRRHEF